MKGKKLTTINDIWRFANPGNPNECWEWRGYLDKYGYGKFNFSKRCHLAHRLSYQLHYGEINPGMEILHTCDNPSCINPRHLYEGTQHDNMIDMYERGRQGTGRGNKSNHLKKSIQAEEI